MKLLWVHAAVFCCCLQQTENESVEMARSAGRSVSRVAQDALSVNIKQEKAEKEDVTDKEFETIKQHCKGRIETLLGGIANEKAMEREILLCQYQEIRMQTKKNEEDRERKMRQKENIEVKNPYKQEFTNEIVNPHNFAFVHQPKKCQQRHTILISVHSATQNIEKRSTIRNTWGNPKIFGEFLPSNQSVKLIFILGLPKDPKNQTMIDYESEAFRDIVQVSFSDHYYNNTYKAIYHLKWVSSPNGCPKVNIVFKTDDDVMFNLRRFPAFWKNFTEMVDYRLSPEYMLIAGNKFGGGPPRNPDHKWYIPVDVFKYDTFPPWFQGMVYLLTPGLARQIYHLSFTTPYLFTDDVYVGIVADRVKKVSRWNLAYYFNFVYDPLDKKMLNWRFDPIVFYHNPTVFEMYKLWFISCSHRSCK